MRRLPQFVRRPLAPPPRGLLERSLRPGGRGPPDTQSCAATPAPVEHLGSFQVGTRFLGPSLGQITSEQSMADAALLALRLAAGPGPLLLSGGAAPSARRSRLSDSRCTPGDAARGGHRGSAPRARGDREAPGGRHRPRQPERRAARDASLLRPVSGPPSAPPPGHAPRARADAPDARDSDRARRVRPDASSAPATEGARPPPPPRRLPQRLPAVAPRRAVAERPPPRVVTSGFPVFAPHVAANPPASSAPVVVARVAAERVPTLPPPAVRSIRLLVERRP